MNERLSPERILIDFLQKPTHIEKLNVGDIPTRNSFMWWTLNADYLARGSRIAEIIYYKWYERRLNVPYREIMTELRFRGGWDALVDAEKDVYKSAYEEEKQHADMMRLIGITDSSYRYRFNNHLLMPLINSNDFLKGKWADRVGSLGKMDWTDVTPYIEEAIREYENNRSICDDFL